MGGLNTSLSGRLRNTNLPVTSPLFPLFEAVVNSIHSIDQRAKQEDNYKGRIDINIIRSAQTSAFGIKPDITGFEIIDNGIGFNSENYESFKTLDSEYKMDLGCRGIGRLLWLKAFKIVKLKSVYIESDKCFTRSFNFSTANGISDENVTEIPNTEIKTSIELTDLSKRYFKYLPRTIETISRNLLEHCIWYFIREGGAPDIIVRDDAEAISLQKDFDAMMIDSSKTDSFSLKKINFDITHIKLKTTHNNKHSISYSAADRVVKEESLIGKLPGLFGTLKEDDEKFAYLCFVTSDYLTKNVTPERLGFNIPETSGLYSEIEISFSEIRNEVMEKVSKFLDPFLSENKEIGMQKVNEFVNTKAPRYKSIINHIPEEERIFDPNISDKELDLKLHSFLMKLEIELLEEGHDILTPNLIENKDEYTKRVQDYLKKSTDVKRYDLANYVTHRKVILDLLTQAVCINEDGKYFKEEIIHKLIMPMQTTSNDVCFEECNLWLIDERLAFHNFLSSDKTLKSIDITNSDSTKEPDILSLNIYDNPLLVNDNQNLPLASITVVEIKRPMRNDAKAGEDKDPIQQALNYLNRVRKGKVKTQTGRLIPNSENIPGFCYVICDITDTVKERCVDRDLEITSDKMGYFGFHTKYNCYIEVISYDRLLNMAKERNRAFFDKLGLPAF